MLRLARDKQGVHVKSLVFYDDREILKGFGGQYTLKKLVKFAIGGGCMEYRRIYSLARVR